MKIFIVFVETLCVICQLLGLCVKLTKVPRVKTLSFLIPQEIVNIVVNLFSW